MDSVNFIIICVSFSLLSSLAVIIISIPQRRLKRFFEQINFQGEGDEKIPRCIGREQVSKYLVKMRFKSTIPTDRWEKIRGDLELLYSALPSRISRNRPAPASGPRRKNDGRKSGSMNWTTSCPSCTRIG